MKTDGVFNLLTALVSFTPAKLAVVSLAGGKVINGTIRSGKPGHIVIYFSLSQII